MKKEKRNLTAICAAEVEPDGVAFDPRALRVEAISAEDEYAGTRVILPARCGTARLTLQSCGGGMPDGSRLTCVHA